MLLVIAKASLPALEFAPRRSHFPPLFSSLGAALAWSATRYLLRSAHIKAHSAGAAAAVDRSWVSTMVTMMAPTIGAKTYNRRATRFPSKVRFAPDSPLAGSRPSLSEPRTDVKSAPMELSLHQLDSGSNAKPIIQHALQVAKDSPLEGDGFELSVKIRPEENCGFPGLAISAIVPQTGAK